MQYDKEIEEWEKDLAELKKKKQDEVLRKIELEATGGRNILRKMVEIVP